MTETPIPEDQNQEQAGQPEQPEPQQVEAAPQKGVMPSPASPVAQAADESSDVLPADERADSSEAEEVQQKEREEAAQQKERLDVHKRWKDDRGDRQSARISQQQSQHFVAMNKQGIILLPLNESVGQQEDLLFVEPAKYQAFVEEISASTDKHILVVSGQESSGKFMTAFSLARKLGKQRGLTYHRFTDISTLSLVEIVYNENLPQGAVIIFDENFTRQNKLNALTDRYFSFNETLADRNNIWFIFTVLDGPIVGEFKTMKFPVLSTEGVDLHQVLLKLIDYHYPADFAVNGDREQLLAASAKLDLSLTPARLGYLFTQKENGLAALIKGFVVAEESQPQASAQIETIQRGMTVRALEERQTPFEWFKALIPMNYQLYALLAVLFERLDLSMLEDIYAVAVHELRRQGMDGPDEFIDPRRIGTGQMHARLGIQVHYNSLEFRDRLYRQYVEAQVENYQRLLWSLIDPDDPQTFDGLLGLIHRLSEYDQRQNSQGEQSERYAAANERLRQLRASIARMIAQVGIYHLPKLEVLLTRLVNDENALVALTAAQVLAEIAQRGGHFDFIEKLLKDWGKSGRFDQMWAAVASISSIYETSARGQEQGEPLDGDESEEAYERTVQAQDQRQYQAKLRELLTELVKVHTVFSDEAKNEERLKLYRAYVLRVQKELEDSTDPVSEDIPRPFRDLSEAEQHRVLDEIFKESKDTLEAAVERDLGLMVNYWRNTMSMALVQTLRNIAQFRSRDVARLVRVWVDRKDHDDPLWKIGHMALSFLFRESINFRDTALLEQAAYPLLDLIPMAMRTQAPTTESLVHDVNLLLNVEDLKDSDTLDQHLEVGNLQRGDPLVYALFAFQRWYENLAHPPVRREKKASEQMMEEEEDEVEEASTGKTNNAGIERWQQAVYTALANAMNNAPLNERQHLRHILFLWLKSNERLLNEIARTLVSHSYVMDGTVMDLPGSKRTGIVVLDNARRDQADRERIFYLLQHLSALIPIHLHWLGYTSHYYRLPGVDQGEEGVVRKSITGPDDLLLRSSPRPSLLVPLLLNGQGQGYAPAQTYFVAVFPSEEILDLAELFPGSAAKSNGQESNIFLREHLNRQNAAALARNQPWQGKLYLLPASSSGSESTALLPFLTQLSLWNLDALEDQLRRRIILTLRSCSPQDLWRELRSAIGAPLAQPPTFAGLAAEIDLWLERLSDTSSLSPDLSLFLLWTVMVYSLSNLPEAIQLVERLLQERNETDATYASRREEKEAKRARKLRQQMGIACTRMLFTFYGVDTPTLPVQPYVSLLSLLPRMMNVASTASELVPILEVLFELARNEAWLQILRDDDGDFSTALGKVSLKELDMLRARMKDYRHLIDLTRLFLEYNHSFGAFLAERERIARRSARTRSQRRAREAVAPDPNGLDGKFLALLPGENDEAAAYRATWALQQIEFQQSDLLRPNASAATLAGLRNLEVLLNHLSDEFQRRQDGTIERLKEGQSYGIVIVEAQSKKAAQQAFGFVKEFVRVRKQGRGQQITLMVQKMGTRELVAKIRTSLKIKSEREISDKRQLPLLIGPLLESYPADQVAFVLLITNSPILDYDDWAEQDEWAERLWLARLGNWQPYRGETVNLGDSTQLTLEMLLRRTGGVFIP